MGNKHFSHKHRLTPHDQKQLIDGETIKCEGCQKSNLSYFYGCNRCHYYICKSCGELPREIQHPFHKEHPLTLLAQSPYGSYDSEVSDDSDSSEQYDHSREYSYCNACRKKCEGFFYHCSACEFDIDVNCATLMPITTDYHYHSSSGHKEEEKQITHPHRLIPCCRKNKDVDFLCSVCHLPIKRGTIYVCLECRAILDTSCTQLPLNFKHHFHPHHSLSLRFSDYFDNPFYHVCNACSQRNCRFSYECHERKPFDSFELDVRCASLMPKREVVQVSQFTHPHVLLPCDTNGTFSFSCSACDITIEDTIYVCLECRIFLHKSCAELPREIKHPFHPPHPLVLSDFVDKYECQACRCSVSGFKYECAFGCNFAIDIICASLRSTVKFNLHPHPLAFFNKPNKDINLITYRKKDIQCSVRAVCSGLNPSFPYFRCVPCDFNLDLFCVPTLPHTFKHSNHGHPLTLTHSRIKDHDDDDDYDSDDDSEYYCDICEERRELAESTYYCEDDHYVYVAHIRCVFNEILPLLERDTSLIQEEIVKLQADIDALIAKLETLTEKLNGLQKRRAQPISDYQVGVMEVGTRNASTD
ncbi:uncharacterized protein LOC132297976 [Cornus florida]|uniref:uncharacterized protein LOC132297976 n=1 Tax=Cornus florida TaxID=4283 RepID=UPI00289BC069|nr:uncharacterized protein LOC132297976 [Cornus florida]XP_059650933.1 uncharacterized protein LOC132297976 [Cornus florida]